MTVKTYRRLCKRILRPKPSRLEWRVGDYTLGVSEGEVPEKPRRPDGIYFVINDGVVTEISESQKGDIPLFQVAGQGKAASEFLFPHPVSADMMAAEV